MDTQKFAGLKTPFYYYDRTLLERTLDTIEQERGDCHLHYAVKANAHPEVLRLIAGRGFGADCVSGWEVQRCLECGFKPQGIVFAGVAKTDWELRLALEAGIGQFNVESAQELEITDSLAREAGVRARVALRINPNVGAHTHANIATGRAENKFGIDMVDMVAVIRRCQQLANVEFVGLHFHIGSQILEMDDFVALAHRINELQETLEREGLPVPANINVGGGLGIDYHEPDESPVPDFAAYFRVWRQHLRLREGQSLHCELGRAVVGQMGSLITSVIFVKENPIKKFAIVDAGFTDLVRPAMYGAYHLVQNVSHPDAPLVTYDVVGPICESTDVFVRDHAMPECRRGDLLAIRSAGAYGEVMASGYNCRPLPKGYLL